jgi:hypothetical protein
VAQAAQVKTQTLEVIRAAMAARAFCHLLQQLTMLVVEAVVDILERLLLLVLPAMAEVLAATAVLLQELLERPILVAVAVVEPLEALVAAAPGVQELLFLNIHKYSQSQLAAD